ncbi:MAG: helix-turn-helix domain-containing protein [Bacteroidales bacterium]|nr:helix-turn-helix domain-containing protein [Bacteroidales bacterium]
MNNVKLGRPVDISNINIELLKDWMNSNKFHRKIIICQSFIALSRNIPMNEVCHVLGVTRESIRLWKEQLRTGGLPGLLKDKIRGKRSKLDTAKKMELESIVKKSPKMKGYKTGKWTGLLVQDFVQKEWGINISLRTAQLWLSKIR